MSLEESESMKKVVKTASLFVATMIVSKIFSYIYRFVIARLGPKDYGILSLGLAIIGILGVIASLGLNNGVIRYIALYHEKKQLGKEWFKIIYTEIRLEHHVKWLNGIINKIPKLYERTFLKALFPAYEIYFKLQVIKK